MDFDSIRLLLESLEEKLKTLRDAIKVDDKKKELINLEKETLKEGFWTESENSSKILSKMKHLKADIII